LRRWKSLAAASLLVVAVVAAVCYWRFTKVHALTEKDTIVIADFANTTGDPVFDAIPLRFADTVAELIGLP
jgi:hypothetical protein